MEGCIQVLETLRRDTLDATEGRGRAGEVRRKKKE